MLTPHLLITFVGSAILCLPQANSIEATSVDKRLPDSQVEWVNLGAVLVLENAARMATLDRAAVSSSRPRSADNRLAIRPLLDFLLALHRLPLLLFFNFVVFVSLALATLWWHQRLANESVDVASFSKLDFLKDLAKRFGCAVGTIGALGLKPKQDVAAEIATESISHEFSGVRNGVTCQIATIDPTHQETSKQFPVVALEHGHPSVNCRGHLLLRRGILRDGALLYGCKGFKHVFQDLCLGVLLSSNNGKVVLRNPLGGGQVAWVARLLPLECIFHLRK
ncbi:hypothetical protein BKA80DRAFT_95252 [Phyllosticta citrichinensis]